MASVSVREPQEVTISKRAETVVLALQDHLLQRCRQYKIVASKLSESTTSSNINLQKHSILQQELLKIREEIWATNTKMKEEIRKGSLEILQNNDAQSPNERIEEPVIEQGRKSMNSPRTSTFAPIIHPSTQCKQEEFLSNLGLMSQEALLIKKQQTGGKVERRRRTANTNPKYSSNGFLKLDELTTRRSKRLEAIPAVVSPTSETPILAYVPPPVLIQSCYVCYGTDFNLSCETCTTKFHADCIKVTASNAPRPHRLPICPKCVQAANTSQRVRMQNRASRPPPSIMQSPAKPVRLPLPKNNALAKLGAVLNGSNAKVRRSNSTTDVDKYSVSKSSNFKTYGSSKKQVEIGAKSKSCNGGTTKPTRISRVKLNMRRSSDEPKGRKSTSPPVNKLASTATNLVCGKQQSINQSAIRWQNKLRTKQIRTYTRKHLPTVVKTDPSQSCLKPPYNMRILENANEVESHEEDEENSLLISSQTVGDVSTSIKTEKNLVDQQIPLVIKNNNNVEDSDSELYNSAGKLTPYKTTIIPSRSLSSCRKRVKRKFASISSPNSKSEILDAVTNRLGEVNLHQRQKRKKRERSLKAKAENAVVIRKTILAMTAAANAVMSNPMKTCEEEDEWANDTVMQSISSVIAWASSDEYECSADQTSCSALDSLDNMPMLMSPSMVKCELQDEDRLDLEEDPHQFDHEQQTMSVESEEDDIASNTGIFESGYSPSCSMRGQLSGDEDDGSETLLSLDSPAPSWADGEDMSRTELVEKMLHVQDPIEKSKLKPVVSCGVVD